MNDTIYRGMRDLVYVALGKTAYSNSSEYLELKKHFRYPGEVLERMEQYGYSSNDDYISAMEVVLWMKETLSAKQMEEMFVGTQLEDFIKRTKEKAGADYSSPQAARVLMVAFWLFPYTAGALEESSLPEHRHFTPKTIRRTAVLADAFHVSFNMRKA